MKTIIVGDIHGRSIWKKISENTYDKFVFIGDYFDTHGNSYSANRQIQNFKDILAFKRANMDKVILLTGNHCCHYIKGFGETYSGYQSSYAIDIGEVIHEALREDLLQMCYIHDRFLCVHAGVTKTWCKDNEIDMNNIEQSINDVFKFQPNKFRFTVGRNFNNYGDDICQTPIWVRPKSLAIDMIDGYTQIVGHTTQDNIIINDKIILIDTLGTSGEYLQIENGIPTALKPID